MDIKQVEEIEFKNGFPINTEYKCQYFSKWRNEWRDFGNQPTGEGEINAMKKSYYEIRFIKI